MLQQLQSWLCRGAAVTRGMGAEQNEVLGRRLRVICVLHASCTTSSCCYHLQRLLAQLAQALGMSQGCTSRDGAPTVLQVAVPAPPHTH